MFCSIVLVVGSRRWRRQVEFGGQQTIDRVLVREDQTKGQAVRAWEVQGEIGEAEWRTVLSLTCGGLAPHERSPALLKHLLQGPATGRGGVR